MMSASRADLVALDRQVEAILRIPITSEAITRRTRRQGLLLGLPLALIIGVVTLGDFKTEGWLSAVGLAGKNERRAIPAISNPMPIDRTKPVIARKAVPLPACEEIANRQEPVVLAVQASQKAQPLTRKPEAKPVIEAASEADYALQQADMPPDPVTQAQPSSERSDAVAKDQPRLETQSRLATLDAIRDLRLK